MSDNPESAPASFRKSVRLMGVLLIVLSPLFVVALTEFVLGFLHDHGSSRAFENERDALTRNSIMPAKFLGDPNGFVKDLKSAKLKVAIFGESSAAGYASPLGFSDFLEKALPDRLIVHNFAEPGSPFVGFQGELAKAVMPFYDVIVLYAGHNEIWSYLYSLSSRREGDVILPWGARVDHKAAYLRHSMKLMSLKRLFNDGLLNADQSVFEKIKTYVLGRAYEVSLHSRLVYLLKSAFSALAPANGGASSQNTDQRLPFFAATAFIGGEAKQAIVSDFAASIREIEAALRPNQTLILSTIISNDLFPPLLDAAGTQAAAAAGETAASFYRSVNAGKLDFSDAEVKTLPGAAHSHYLEAVLCMGGVPPAILSGAFSSDCQHLALEARAGDALPLRALPGLNDFIRSQTGARPNIRVIDPDAAVRASQERGEYLDRFVDFQHPSALAHMTIAELVIRALPLTEEVTLTPAGDCDSFTAYSASGHIDIRPDPMIYRLQLQSNINWHNSFMKRVSVPDMYALYKAKAEAKAARCLPR